MEQELPDSVKQYLREIGQIPLLTPWEELWYGFLKDWEGWDGVLTDQEVAMKLKAFNILVEANLRLVVGVAKMTKHTVPLLDRIENGNIGLLNAVRKYDWRRGYRFSTPSVKWIQQAISRDTSGRTGLSIPTHQEDREMLLKRLSERLHKDLGHEPGYPDIQAALHEYVRTKLVEKLQKEEDEHTPSEEEVKVFAKEKGLKLSVNQIAYLMNLPSAIPIETPIGSDGDQLGDILQAPEVIAPLISSGELEPFLVLLRKIPDGRKLERVLKFRCGIETGHAMELEKVGHQFGITRERVRQLETDAIRWIKDNHGDVLRAYIRGSK